jgi:hypothetical protein
MTRALARFYGARHLDRSAKQQQFFGQRGLARVGVRDDRESSAPRSIANEICRKAVSFMGWQSGLRRACRSRKKKAAGRQASGEV